MQPMKARSNSKLTTLVLGSLAALVVVSIILFPDKAFQSSLEGLTIWWKIVFPALMPFLIMTELLVGFGVIQGTGVLLEPLMRVVFRLPGVSGWALASGLIIGFPTGAKITATLSEKNLISRTETERLTALSHLCSPLFLIMVIGVGFLHSAKLGIVLAVVHYVTAILTGILMRFSKEPQQPLAASSELNSSNVKPKKNPSISIWKLALSTMRQAYLHDGRAFGKLLGDSVTSSVQTLMLIGGYMMIFSVLINVINITHLTDALQPVTHFLLRFMNTHTDTTPQWIIGILEVHLGAYAWSQAQGLSLLPQMALISAFLAWGGLSAHAQVAGFHQKTGARYRFFFQSRALHAVLALVFTILLWEPMQLLLMDTEPSFLWLDKATSEYSEASFPLNGGSAWSLWGPMLAQFLLLLIIMLTISTLIRAFRKKVH
ncbi:sporulation integral membrane protein YlbJ [Paenibacillus sp. yr247]|uniref:nucleoside recognition domain-containing protein n=1 Tax=Paenibacillus sp. yr247 TaxID=1761880 RepID=UPI000885710A|nr:nucleoside recognition domain-containing protein [Paenibacillus sp. yr247]SDM96461.1 sporulation integral membrane protein YlbJ [Paenibacillus sp. yr247]